MKHSFFLVIPRQQNNPQRLQEFEAKVLQQWIDELPSANPELAARLVQDLIMDLNSIAMPAQLRLDTLELLRPSVLAIEEFIRSRLMATGFPKEETDYKIHKLLVSITQELTTGYWMVLKELTARDISWFKGKNAALSIQRSIKGLSSIAIDYFMMGMSTPDWIWMDLHGLYKLSVKIKKDTIKVANDPGHFNKTSSPEDCYLQILLLSLADTTGLMQKEILLVYRFIEKIASFVSLKNSPVSNQSIYCTISTEEDNPPHFQTESDIDRDAVLLYIDFSQLFEAFEQKKIMLSTTEARFSAMHEVENKTPQNPTEGLLEYLIQRWSGHTLQSAPLFSDRLDRYIAIGLMPTFSLQKSSDTGNEEEIEFLVQSESSWLLSCVFTKAGVLSVGSLVSLRKTDESEHARLLGVVDKLFVAKDKSKIIFGVSLLAQQFIAVTYLPLDVNQNNVPKKALLYSTSEPDKNNRIIIDSFRLKEGNGIRLFINQKSYAFVLKNRKNVGLGYWQFDCNQITVEARRP